MWNWKDGLVIIISAMGRNRVIGSGDGMPWDVPEEYQHFLDTTRDQTIIIGRKSFGIFGPTLTCRHCIVLSRSEQAVENASIAHNFDDAIIMAADTGTDVYVAGGASIYEMAVHTADRMLLSYIEGDFEGDAFFPEIPDRLTVTSREHRGSYELVQYDALGKL